ncbi:unnamed protein product [Chilo suppressalis]|uniref:Glutamine amidotransferase type-2 domain-containing protein n=1 Tax=Chilo suppressalis TaxID=168631 RepID=A0ABN8B8Z1_CHISP|nr:unnamed protein product [Chilo suppressalis]
MCGILCEISRLESGILKDSQTLHCIHRRGPDGFKTVEVNLKAINLYFCGAVLWMQGSHPVLQPLENDKGILLYNGDIFDWNWDQEKNDTEIILGRFKTAVSIEEIVNEIKKLKGPFSLIYFNKSTNEIIFCRDIIGRNSLLFCNDGNSIKISSVLGRTYECIEIPATNIYILNLTTYKVQLYPWDNNMLEHEYKIDEWLQSVKLLQNLDNNFDLDCNLDLDFNYEDSVTTWIEITAQKTNDKIAIMNTLLNNTEIRKSVVKILDLLDKSVELRTKTQPMKCKNCLYSTNFCDHSSLGILFSGGLDCTILAYLVDKHLPKEQSIDLINVAFKKDKNTYDVPDRLTGKQSLEELKELCPHRNWIFKEINIPNDVLLENQEKVIADLIYPRQTILDESLGSAMWFAAQGNDGEIVSPCRVLILGSGADELFGGYTRHRNAFKRNGWIGLHKELLFDWKRISFRNLARDNRVISDHGRQPRMPYLDEDFTQHVLELKPWFKCFPSEDLGPGIGDKLFLRLTAFHLGLQKVAVLPKRALQFGSRIANKKEKVTVSFCLTISGDQNSMHFKNGCKSTKAGRQKFRNFT